MSHTLKRFFSKIYDRTYQSVARNIVMPLMNYHEPEKFLGADTLLNIADILRAEEKGHPMIVTTDGMVRRGQLEDLLQSLNEAGIQHTIFSDVEPNPSVASIEKIADAYKKNGCDAIVAVGGGSVLDASKLGGARIGNPNKTLRKMAGILKVKKQPPLLICVPTTAGTGSEVTLAAVFTDGHDKLSVMDTKLIPDFAILDPMLHVTLPKKLTAGTGMDALTHAVESYLSKTRTDQTIADAREAVLLISQHLRTAYHEGEDAAAREQMLLASYLAGRAFSRSYVGYIHALSHPLSAYYGLPHGQTNATIMPIMLRFYGEPVHDRLAELAKLIGLEGNSEAALAEAFIRWIEAMNKELGIAEHIPEIRDDDIEPMVDHAIREAHPLYPVPVHFIKPDLIEAYHIIRGDHDA